MIANAAGDIVLTETEGNLNVRKIASANGDVVLVANLGSILDAGYVAPGKTQLDEADIVGNSISLRAKVAIGQAGR